MSDRCRGITLMTVPCELSANKTTKNGGEHFRKDIMELDPLFWRYGVGFLILFFLGKETDLKICIFGVFCPDPSRS